MPHRTYYIFGCLFVVVVVVVVVFSFVLVWRMAKLGAYSPTLISAMVSSYAVLVCISSL